MSGRGSYPRTRKGLHTEAICGLPVAVPGTDAMPEPNPQGYSHRTDDRAAMMRSTTRTHAELEADKLQTPDIKTGLASRQAMPCQAGNNQFPFGKSDHDETY